MPTVPALPRPRSPLGRAVLPVAGGFGVLLLVFGATWGIAAWISRGGAESTTRLAPTTFTVGDVARWSESIEESGPVLFAGLNTSSGERTLVLDHTGDDPTRGWQAYWAYPADGEPSCAVQQVPDTDRFTDCDGRELSVSDLADPVGVCVEVADRETLSINLRCGTAAAG